MASNKSSNEGNIYFALARIVLGFLFFWAFLDKLLGLGYSTKPEQAWLNGGSPTSGFLLHGVHGPFVNVFHALAGSAVVDWLFMVGLLGIGLCFILGIGLTIAGYAGALLAFLMWLSLYPSAANPLFDEHVIYIFLFLGYATSHIGTRLSLQDWWSQTDLVKRNPILR